MLTEQFINLCGAVLMDGNSKFNESVLSDIFSILHHYKIDHVPLECRKKYHLIQTISKLRLDKKNPDEVLDYVTATGSFKDIEDYLKVIHSKNIPDEKVLNVVKNISDRKKYILLLRDMPQIEEFIKKINGNSFTDLGDANKSWESLVQQISNRVSEEKRKDSIVDITHIDLLEDSLQPIIEEMERSFDTSNSISTGYEDWDRFINGGMEQRRLYIVAGSSGGGKSITLMNLAKNACERKKPESPEKDLYLYFTMENSIMESIQRFYCNLKDTTLDNLKRNFYMEKLSMGRTITEWETLHNSVLMVSYFPATLTSVSDLMNHTEKVKARYAGRGKVKAMYVDYLDLLKSGQTFDQYRLEQGQVTIDLKVAAVTLKIPVATATQIVRAGYDNKNELSVTMLSESIKKVEHSDFVGLIRTLEDEPILGQAESPWIKMIMLIGKNRSGPKNKTINLLANFSQFKIKDNSRGEGIQTFESPIKSDHSFI